jgi:hypothetical protein
MVKRLGIVLLLLFIVTGLTMSTVSADKLIKIEINYNNELGNHIIGYHTFDNYAYKDVLISKLKSDGVISEITFDGAQAYQLLQGPGEYYEAAPGIVYEVKILNNQ